MRTNEGEVPNDHFRLPVDTASNPMRCLSELPLTTVVPLTPRRLDGLPRLLMVTLTHEESPTKCQRQNRSHSQCRVVPL